jgi:hypothetical protein
MPMIQSRCRMDPNTMAKVRRVNPRVTTNT